MAEQSLIEFLSTLRGLDARVRADNGQLRVSGPDGVLTPELRSQLTARKEEILAFLRQADLAVQTTPGIQPAARNGMIPLSFSQQRIWLFDQLEPRNPAYNIPASVKLIGPVDVVALHASINEVIRRHEVLRTTFGNIMGEASQVISPAISLPLPVTDLRSLPLSERVPAASRAATEEAKLPFDLAAGPLVRAQLLRLADEEYVLLLTVHHVVSDDWSMGVFVSELAALYQSFSASQPSSLPDLPIQYADYAVWQQSDPQNEILRFQLEFWKERLAPVASLAPIPTDKPRLASPTFRGERRFRMLPEHLVEQLKALSQKEESTLFMFLLAAFNLLLGQYMGRDQIVIGSPVAGRTRHEIEGLIGFFVNSVVLRTDLSGDPSFRQLLARVRETTSSAYSHQDVPLEQVVDALRPERQQNQAPIFQIFFNMLNTASQRVEIPGLKIEPLTDFIVGAPNIGAKFDLTLVAVEHPHGLQLDISYNIDLFEPATIDWLLEHMQTILENAVSDPNRLLSAFPRLPVNGRNHIEPTHPFAEFLLEETGQSLPARFEKQVEQHAACVAVSINGEALSYGQLNHSANRLARAIQLADDHSRLENKEQTVALLLGHDAGMITGMLATLKSGKIFVAIDPGYPQDRITAMLHDSRARLMITNTRYLPLAQSLHSQINADIRILNIDQVDPSLADENLGLAIDPDQIAYIVYTSGSSGRPKGVMQSHRNVLHFIRNYTNGLHLSASDRLSLIPSFSFSAAMMDTFGALLNGAGLFPFDLSSHGLDQLASWLTENEITVYHSVPTIFRHFVSALSAQTAFPHLRMIDFGGEPVSRRDVELYRQHFSADCLLVNGLGATELNVIRQFILNHTTAFPGNTVPVGYEVPDTRILLLDEQGREVGFNQAAEMVIESRYLACGYWQQPEQTQAAFKDVADGKRRYYTGDLGRLRPDGCLEHLGRKDLQLKIHGVRIEPAEIEVALLEQQGVKEAAVLARDNSTGEKTLVAYLVSKDEKTQPSIETLRNSLLEKLPAYMLPSEFVLVQAMPLTPTGKIDRRALLSPAVSHPAAGSAKEAGQDSVGIKLPGEQTEYIAPRTPAEAAWVKIWQDILRIDRVGVNDNFFDLGGDSLLVMHIIAKGHEAGLHFTPRDFSRYQTIAGLSARAGSTLVPEPAQELVTGLLPLTISQGWFFNQGFQYPHRWNVTRLLEVPAGIEPELFEQAMRYLWTYHDGLRTRFVQTEDGWRQIIAPADQGAALPFSYIDFSDLEASKQTDSIERAANEMQDSLSLIDGPLMRVAFFNLGENRRGRLLIILHHSIYDGASTIFFDDSYTVYQQLSRGEPALLPTKTTPVRTWLEKLGAYTRSAELHQERDYWFSLPWEEVHALPVDFPENRGKNIWRAAHSVKSRLSTEETELLLRDIPRAYGVQIIDVLVAALADVLAKWTRNDWLLFDSVDFGRNVIPNADDLDLSRTVGWFSMNRHLALQRGDHNEPDELLKSIKTQLQGMPNRALGYELLLYGSEDKDTVAKLQKLPRAEVALNYSGYQYSDQMRSNAEFTGAYEYPGSLWNLEDRRPYILDCSVQVVDGQLITYWRYSKNLHKQSTIKRLAEEYIQWLQALLAQYALSK